MIESINSFNEKISSSRIEPLIQSGKVDLANDLLGYIYSVDGKVEHGYKRGTKLLNIPTANLKVNSDYLLPSNGVYAGYVSINEYLYPAMINVGNNPTFENNHITLEANIFDFSKDIYGKQVRFYFLKKTRSEIKFADFNALKMQLNQDIITCKNVLKTDQSHLDLTLSLWHKKLFDILK